MTQLQSTRHKKIKIVFWSVIIFMLFFMITSYIFVDSFDRYCFDDFSDMPHNHVGLLLGTAPQMADGKDNLFFTYRINTATTLINEEKIDFILISGDNHTQGYNEPIAIQEALIAKGVPEEKLVLDYAGFCTLDSIIRAKEIFGQDKLTIISQQFHNERAAFIAHHYGINAICANATDVPATRSPRVRIREIFARVKVVLDIYILQTQPKFLGEKIIIE